VFVLGNRVRVIVDIVFWGMLNERENVNETREAIVCLNRFDLVMEKIHTIHEGNTVPCCSVDAMKNQ